MYRGNKDFIMKKSFRILSNESVLKNKKLNHPEIVEILKQGGIGILATDTLYGLVGQALNKKTVRRIYQIKGRQPRKPLIILIYSLKDLDLFKIKIKPALRRILNKLWPGRVSIILGCPHKQFFYLHRGTNTLAFRLPKKASLINILKQVGPLTAPSANPEGLKPAKTIKEAKKYFGYRAEFYLDEGKLDSLPSTLLEIKNRKIKILRQGAIKIKI